MALEKKRATGPRERAFALNRSDVNQTRCSVLPDKALKSPTRLGVALKLPNSRGLRSLGTHRHVKLDFLALRQRLEAFPFDGRKVDENIRAPFLFDETVAFIVIKPLHETGWHNAPSLIETSKTRRLFLSLRNKKT
jgi:hypothetical protein